jgi:hypothetical protein
MSVRRRREGSVRLIDSECDPGRRIDGLGRHDAYRYVSEPLIEGIYRSLCAPGDVAVDVRGRAFSQDIPLFGAMRPRISVWRRVKPALSAQPRDACEDRMAGCLARDVAHVGRRDALEALLRRRRASEAISAVAKDL